MTLKPGYFFTALAAFLIGIVVCWYSVFGSRPLHSYPPIADNMVVTVMANGKHPVLFGLEDRYALRISRFGDSYGHYLELSLFHGYQDRLDYLKHCLVVETEDGLRFIQPSGHLLFVPRKAYTGGR